MAGTGNRHLAERRASLESLLLAVFLQLAFLAPLTGPSCDAAAIDKAPETASVDFNRDIRPILSDRCFRCHGPDSNTREADLRLDLEEDAQADLGGYAAIVPGDVAASELVSRILTDDESMRMPPVDSRERLSPREIDLLVRWIREGAAWSPSWAYAPPRRTEPPTAELQDWSRVWIDDFILERLEQEGLQPAPAADRVTLARRLSFDLTGLPPLPEEVDRFATDQDPESYQRLVDRLLDSPHFGERMAIYWLDLVRFADTVGYHGDQTHNIWPYRDYVIMAFNNNKPFDVFTREQLAGDLLANAGDEQLVASGYNRLLQTSHEGGVQLKEYRAIYMADRVRNVSQVWLGATMGCAQCHDHKYDPITTRDFYQLGAFFADVDDEEHLRNPKQLNGLPSPRIPELEVLGAYQRLRWNQLRAKLEQLDPVSDADAVKELQQQIKQLEGAKARTMVTKSAPPREVRILPRGNWLDESGPVVTPAAPKALGAIATTTGSQPTRLDLARWLTDDNHGVGGLTARVMVNRLWYLMFGRGIAPVLDDFGGQGEPPEHPELLDNLAVEFVESGWDVKHMLRLIANSAAYRQSSAATPDLIARDPDNRLIARQAQYRVSAEMVRDAALRVSGLLDPEIGGPSARPYQPTGYYRHLNFPKRTYAHDTNRQQWRRGLYVHWQRQFLHPMMRAFDAPRREECTAERPRSNTALAALTLLNDPSFIESANAFAEILLKEADNFDARLTRAFRRAVSRQPTSAEGELFRQVYRDHRQYYESHPADVERLITVGLHTVSDDLDRVELAAWTGLTRILLNLGETTTRN